MREGVSDILLLMANARLSLQDSDRVCYLVAVNRYYLMSQIIPIYRH